VERAIVVAAINCEAVSLDGGPRPVRRGRARQLKLRIADADIGGLALQMEHLRQRQEFPMKLARARQEFVIDLSRAIAIGKDRGSAARSEREYPAKERAAGGLPLGARRLSSHHHMNATTRIA